MIYNIMAFGDIHFGAMDAVTTYENLYAIIHAIEYLKDKIDLIVICGDYYDYKLQLNSDSALKGLEWFSILYQTARENGVKKLRIFKGTEEHDHSQLEAFRSYETEDGFFRIFNENTIEETLPDLHCIYCPDETLNEKDYKDRYLPNMMTHPDIGFFHGSFDVVMPSIALEIAEKRNIQNIIYRFNEWTGMIKGPMISSHWHNPYHDENLYYIGSYDRWAFGEEDQKGFCIVRYDTETSGWAYTSIPNPYALEYKTFMVNSAAYQCHMDYSNLAEEVYDYMKDNPSAKIRISIKITDDRPENHDYIKAFQQRFINCSRKVKIDVTDTVKKREKQQKKKNTTNIMTQYGFIFNKTSSVAEKIQKYLFEKYNISRELSEIEEVIAPYLPK